MPSRGSRERTPNNGAASASATTQICAPAERNRRMDRRREERAAAAASSVNPRGRFRCGTIHWKKLLQALAETWRMRHAALATASTCGLDGGDGLASDADDADHSPGHLAVEEAQGRTLLVTGLSLPAGDSSARPA